MKSLFFILFFVIFTSCGTHEKKTTEKNQYSDETNRTFEMIERGEAHQKRAPAPTPKKTILKKEKSAVSLLPIPEKKISNEIFLELEQTIAFFCMKHKKDEKKCLSSFSKTKNYCIKKHSSQPQKILKCVQKKM